MTLLGWLAGKTVVTYIAAVDHWVAFGLLAFVGVRMIRSGLRKEGEEPTIPDPSRGMTLVMLSIATSIDALAVGLSFGVPGRECVLVCFNHWRGICCTFPGGSDAWQSAWHTLWQNDGDRGWDHSDWHRLAGVITHLIG